MQKLVLDIPLEHKPERFVYKESVVEKTVYLNAEQFDRLRDAPLRDHEAIQNELPYMWPEKEQVHGVLYIGYL